MTVADVYDMAADIGKEFEFLIDAHGPETVSGLMQKVISFIFIKVEDTYVTDKECF